MTDAYPDSIAFTDGLGPLSGHARKRRLRDSNGNWHAVTQSEDILFKFDELIGLSGRINADVNRFFNLDIEIIDEALRSAQETGLPLDLCFQMIVLRRSHQAMLDEIDAERKN